MTITKIIVSIDDAQASIEHSEIIKNKFVLRTIYTEYYELFKKRIEHLPDGKIIELGSGGGFIKDIIPNTITSDVIEIKGCDMIILAEKLPFPDNSLKAILMVDVLHHIKTVENFFNEANRCLIKGGKIIMVEPANTFWARIIWKNFHHEPFDDKAGWNIEGSGRMSNANIALPWIIFKRDRELFKKKFPNFKIVSIDIHTPLAYLLSGGVKKWTLLPPFLYKKLRFFERTIKRLGINQGMFQTIELQKISVNS